MPKAAAASPCCCTTSRRSTPKPGPPEPWFPEPAPGPLSLLLRGWLNSLMLAAAAAHAAGAPAAPAPSAAYDLRPRSAAAAASSWLATRFNSVVSAHRVFDTRRFLVEEFESHSPPGRRARPSTTPCWRCAVARCAAICRPRRTARASLSAITPVHARQLPPADATPQLSWLRVQLGTDLADPVERLQAIRAAPRPHSAPDGGATSPGGATAASAAATLALEQQDAGPAEPGQRAACAAGQLHHHQRAPARPCRCTCTARA